MGRFTRRTFLASPALLAAQPEHRRSLLVSLWNPEKLRERFHPFPTAAERTAWEALPADASAALLASGEKQLETSWDALPATVFLEYARNGNRSRFESIRDRRRNKLQQLVIAECL